jgi:tRNA-splicing ligase RtcB
VHRTIDGIAVWGREPDAGAVAQMRTCARVGDVQATALMADHHLGYSQPIGGVVAYRDAISPTGVGYDIACGVKAVRTDLTLGDVAADVPRLVDEIAARVAFGLGRTNPTPVDHPLFASDTWRDVRWLRHLRDPARAQLGTVGSGNHYVDVLAEYRDGDETTGRVDDASPLWVACHFGSRGFGHKTASGFINLAKGNGWREHVSGESMEAEPTLIERRREPNLFEAYVRAMELAGEYAYAGRDHVVGQVLAILGARSQLEVHNHHNFAWPEEHDGEPVWVVRKGATPAFPGQLGFVGGSMGDIAAVVEGVEGPESAAALRSTVHGAGRIMSRSMARGSRPRRGVRRRQGLVSREMMQDAVRSFGVVVRGGDTDESPHVYRPLRDVLDAHRDTIRIRHLLRPIGVVMAGADVRDPYRD